MKQTQNNLNMIKYIKNSYNDEAFFLSKGFNNKMQNLAKFLTGRYRHSAEYQKIDVELFWDINQYIAKTNNSTIYINCNNYLISDLTKENRCLAIIGFLGHEVGHCIFTDFQALNQFLNDQYDYSRLSAKAFEFYKKNKIQFFKYISNIQNILEDAYIENRMCQNFSGSIKNGIEFSTKLLQKNIVKRMFSEKADIYTYLLAQARNCLDDEFYEKFECFNKTKFCFDELYEQPYPSSKRRNELVLDIFSMVFDDFISEDELISNNNEKEKNDNKNNKPLSLEKAINKYNKPLDLSNMNIPSIIPSNNSNNAFDIHSIIQSVSKSILTNDNNVLLSYNKHEFNEQMNSVESEVNIIKDGSEEFYKKIVNECMPIIRKSTLLVRDSVFQKRRSLQQKKQEKGCKLDINAYIKRKNIQDNNIFINSKKPNKKPQIAITMIIDESGSMESSIVTVKKAVTIVNEFCNRLNIPLLIIGHNCYNEKINIDIYKDFDSMNNCALTKIKTEGTNRDGYALKYGLNLIKKRNEPYKIVFAISDGAPSAYNSYKEAFDDVKDALALYNKNKIDYIAFAISDDFDTLSELYGDKNIVDSRNLEQFPKELAKIIANKSKKAYKKENY